MSMAIWAHAEYPNLGKFQARNALVEHQRNRHRSGHKCCDSEKSHWAAFCFLVYSCMHLLIVVK